MLLIAELKKRGRSVIENFHNTLAANSPDVKPGMKRYGNIGFLQLARFRGYEVKRYAKGYRLELYDCIICATALVKDQILVTRNTKHYSDKRLRLFVPTY